MRPDCRAETMTDLAYHNVDVEKAPAPAGCPIDHEFSPFSERYVTYPYAWLAEKRENEPIFYAQELGYVVVTRMEEIHEVFMNPEIYSSANVQDPVNPICDEAKAVLATDDFNPVAVMSNRQPPDHGRIRKYTQKGFSVRRMKAMEPYIRQRAHELVDQMLAAGPPIDFVGAFGHPLPGDVIFRFIGFPEDMYDDLTEWCSDRLAFSWGYATPEDQVKIGRSSPASGNAAFISFGTPARFRSARCTCAIESRVPCAVSGEPVGCNVTGSTR